MGKPETKRFTVEVEKMLFKEVNVMRASEGKTKKQIVDEALRLFLQNHHTSRSKNISTN